MISSTVDSKPNFVSESIDYSPELGPIVPVISSESNPATKHWLLFAASIFLVSVPVFIQTPLVRLLPWVSLALTPVLAMVGIWLRSRFVSRWWGDLLIGFTWTWLAGSLYWGWLRWEPFLHLPVEAIGLPFAIWGITRQRNQIGHYFYLGSLFGTAITDLYFYLVALIPYWRKLMQVESEAARSIFQSALAQMQTPWGIGWVAALAVVLLGVGAFPLRSRQAHWWAFSGAVLSTILVDALFWLAATTA